MDKFEKLGLQLQKVLEAINVKKIFYSINSSESIPLDQKINETPTIIVLTTTQTHIIPDGLISYSIFNSGNTDILINGFSIPPGVIINEKQDLDIGNLIGCIVESQLSEVIITQKNKN